MTIMTVRFMLLKRSYPKFEFGGMLAGIPFKKVEVRTENIGREAWIEK